MFLRGSSQIRSAFRCLLTRTRDEKPHRNAKYAYLCATRFSACAGEFKTWKIYVTSTPPSRATAARLASPGIKSRKRWVSEVLRQPQRPHRQVQPVATHRGGVGGAQQNSWAAPQCREIRIDRLTGGTLVCKVMLRALAHHHHHFSFGVACQWANA